jgi:hypothetical protein
MSRYAIQASESEWNSSFSESGTQKRARMAGDSVPSIVTVKTSVDKRKTFAQDSKPSNKNKEKHKKRKNAHTRE